jgi:predicted peptidase
MSRRLTLSLSMWLAALVSFPAAAGFVSRQVTIDHHSYRYQVFVPDGWTSRRTWPVVLFLHGSGERGDDNARQLSQGLPPWLREHGANFPALVVMPQAPAGSYWNGVSERMAMRALADSVAEFRGDRRRLYLTGLSMGGYGVWQFAIDHPGVFAAAAPICGALGPISDEPALHVLGVPPGADPYAWVAAHIGALPVWIFHGAADDVVPPGDDRRLYATLQARGAEAHYTEFPGVNHGSWVPAYATPELWPWMFAHRLAAAPSR